METDLQLSSSDYSLAVSIFFVGESVVSFHIAAPRRLTHRVSVFTGSVQYDSSEDQAQAVPARHHGELRIGFSWTVAYVVVCLGLPGNRLCGRQQQRLPHCPPVRAGCSRSW
jgi:hypothetical protein